MVGYATVYTMFPAFSFVLDRDINEDLALLYPELYKVISLLLQRDLILWLTRLSGPYERSRAVLQDVLYRENQFLI